MRTLAIIPFVTGLLFALHPGMAQQLAHHRPVRESRACCGALGRIISVVPTHSGVNPEISQKN